MSLNRVNGVIFGGDSGTLVYRSKEFSLVMLTLNRYAIGTRFKILLIVYHLILELTGSEDSNLISSYMCDGLFPWALFGIMLTVS